MQIQFDNELFAALSQFKIADLWRKIHKYLQGGISEQINLRGTISAFGETG